MKYFRKYGIQIIAGLLALVLVQSIALVSVLTALEKKEEPSIGADGDVDIAATMSDMAEPEKSDSDAAGDEQVVETKEDAPPVTAPIGAPSASEILAETNVIAHGMGMIDGVTTLNCLEGFQQQYAKGVRVFEVDLRQTSDLQVVLRHDWRALWQEGVSEWEIPTLEEFRAKPLLEKYTALSFRDLLLLMVEYPDICIITDSKFTDAEIVTLQFEAMLRDARELGLESLFDRIVVQIYSELMFKVVNNIRKFPHYIYTLYNTGFDPKLESFEKVAAFCSENGIDGVTMWSYWWKEEFAPVAQQSGLSVYVHTVNDREQAKSLIASGVSGVYTDEIVPDDLRPEEKPELPDKKGRDEHGTDRKETFR